MQLLDSCWWFLHYYRSCCLLLCFCTLATEDTMQGRKTSLAVHLTAEQQAELEHWQRSPTVQAGWARRGRQHLARYGAPDPGEPPVEAVAPPPVVVADRAARCRLRRPCAEH